MTRRVLSFFWAFASLIVGLRVCLGAMSGKPSSNLLENRFDDYQDMVRWCRDTMMEAIEGEGDVEFVGGQRDVDVHRELGELGRV